MVINFIHSQCHSLPRNMAPVIYQLATIILVAIAVQTSVTAEDLQDYEDYEESDVSYSRKLINFLKILNLQPQWPTAPRISSDDFVVDSPGFEDVDEEDDDRQARRIGSTSNYDTTETFCMMVTKQQLLSDTSFEYRPSILDEKICQPITGAPDHHLKGLCYVRGKSCQTVVREATFFKRQRHGGHCWKPEIRNISDGCRCYFDRHNLRGKTYTG